MEYRQEFIRREILVFWRLLDYLCFGIVEIVHSRRGKYILRIDLDAAYMERVLLENAGVEGWLVKRDCEGCRDDMRME